MSAITLTFHNVIVFPRTRSVWIRTFAEDVSKQPRTPVVSPKWTVETGPDGTGKLVQHWFKNRETM